MNSQENPITKEYIKANLLNKKGCINHHKTKHLKETVIDLYCIYNNVKQPQCYCGEIPHFNGFLKGFNEYCSRKCLANSTKIKNKKKETCISKYGSTSPAGNKEIQAKIEKTNKEKYGVGCVFQSTEIKDKSKETMLEKYGVEHNSQLDSVLQARKNTWTKNLGVDNPMKSKLIKRKLYETNKEKYGVGCVFQSTEIKDKSKETMLEKYGVEHPALSKYILNKQKITRIKNGNQKSDEDISDFYYYYKEVWRETRKYEHLVENINLRGHLNDNPDALHLDHKFSIAQGFKENIPIHIIGGLSNLEMLPARENSSKGSNCSITIEKLT